MWQQPYDNKSSDILLDGMFTKKHPKMSLTMAISKFMQFRKLTIDEDWDVYADMCVAKLDSCDPKTMPMSEKMELHKVIRDFM